MNDFIYIERGTHEEIDERNNSKCTPKVRSMGMEAMDGSPMQKTRRSLNISPVKKTPSSALTSSSKRRRTMYSISDEDYEEEHWRRRREREKYGQRSRSFTPSGLSSPHVEV